MKTIINKPCPYCGSMLQMTIWERDYCPKCKTFIPDWKQKPETKQIQQPKTGG